MSLTSKLFSFEGRIGRADWWWLSLGLGVIQVAGVLMAISIASPPAVPMGADGKPLVAPPDLDVAAMLGWLILPFLLTLWPSLAVQVKRWHDRDKGAVWLLIQFIPYVGPLWAVVELGFLPGTPGGNRFGDGAGAAERLAAVFDEVALAGEEDRAAVAIARWQGEQSRPASPTPAWPAPSASTGAARGFGRRGLSPA